MDLNDSNIANVLNISTNSNNSIANNSLVSTNVSNETTNNSLVSTNNSIETINNVDKFSNSLLTSGKNYSNVKIVNSLSNFATDDLINLNNPVKKAENLITQE